LRAKSLNFIDAMNYAHDQVFDDDFDLPIPEKDHWQIYLLNARLPELCHARQMKERGALKY
jgi:hypothetical protein